MLLHYGCLNRNILFLFSPEKYVFDRDSCRFHLLNDTLIRMNYYVNYVAEDNDGNLITANDTALLKLKFNKEKYSFEVVDYKKLGSLVDYQNLLGNYEARQAGYDLNQDMSQNYYNQAGAGQIAQILTLYQMGAFDKTKAA